MNYCDCGDYCEWCRPDLVYGKDAREPYGACPLCGEPTCICENRFDVEPGFFED